MAISRGIEITRAPGALEAARAADTPERIAELLAVFPLLRSEIQQDFIDLEEATGIVQAKQLQMSIAQEEAKRANVFDDDL